MGAIRKIDVSVSKERASEIDAAVASGEFATIDEVIADAIDAWTVGRLPYDHENTLRLRRLWEEGIASGPAVEMTDDWFEDVKRRGRARIEAVQATR